MAKKPNMKMVGENPAEKPELKDPVEGLHVLMREASVMSEIIQDFHALTTGMAEGHPDIAQTLSLNSTWMNKALEDLMLRAQHALVLVREAQKRNGNGGE